jgi:hypothetical protein
VDPNDQGFENSFRGVVVKRSYSGMMVKLEIQANAQFTLTSFLPSNSGEAKLSIGSEVSVHWKSEDTLLLHAEKLQ